MMTRRRGSACHHGVPPPLDERELRMQALRAAIIEGEQSGASTPFDVDAFIDRKCREQTHSAGNVGRNKRSALRRFAHRKQRQ